MKRSYSLAATIIILAAFLVLVNLVSAMVLRHARVDLTSEKLYTLSSGTKGILDKLEDRLRFKFYLTGDEMKDLPSIQLYSTRVKEMLEEYVKLSGGKVSLALFDPKPDTEEEEVAQKYGLQKVPLKGGGALYMGLVISDESGNDEVIPFFNPEREKFLEYDISKAVVNVLRPEKKVVGILSPLELMGDNMPAQMRAVYGGGGSEPWALVSQLRQLYRVKEIDKDAQAIDEDVDILMLVHPKGLSPPTRLAIDQYLLKGGRIVAFIDPNCEADMPPPNPENPYESYTYDRSSDAGELLASWGLSMKKDELAGDMNLAASVRSQTSRVVPYPLYLSMDAERVNRGEVMTAGIESLLFASAGVLKASDAGGDLEIVPLLQTTEEGGVVRKEPFMDVERVLNDFVKGKEKLALAYRVSGSFKTAFPNGLGDGEGSLKPELRESKEPSSVVVFSDADFISDRFSANSSNFFGQKIVSLINDNLNFAFNAVEAMAGSQDLIAVRSRGSFEKPFTKVAEMQRDAQEKWRAKEAELKTKVQELEQKLNSLQSRRDAKTKGQVLSSEQMAEIESFKEERLLYQKKLREVRKNLREDVERLERNLKFLNIWFMPIVVTMGALMLHFARGRRREI